MFATLPTAVEHLTEAVIYRSITADRLASGILLLYCIVILVIQIISWTFDFNLIQVSDDSSLD